MVSVSPAQREALVIARELAELGMPLFLATPDASKPGGFALPSGWQRSTADPQVVDHWQPGMALCAVTGVVLDLIDIDPRSGGQLPDAVTPPIVGLSRTPSGGMHYFVPALGVASRDGVYPGVDVKSGLPDGSGRGFAFLAPTERTSKVDGVIREYIWDSQVYPGSFTHWLPRLSEPSTTWIGSDNLRARIAELRSPSANRGSARRVPRSVAAREWDQATAALVTDLRHWAAHGWGGEAHAGLLAASTHLARLSPEHAFDAFAAAFHSAGLTMDTADLVKIHSAIDNAVPDHVLPDEAMDPTELFLLGGTVPDTERGDVGHPAVARLGDSPAAQPGHVFAPVTRERFRNRKPPSAPTAGHFGGVHGLFYGEGVHWLQGESESGKSWVALGVVAEALAHDQWCCYVDYEHTEDSILERLECLGVTDDQVERLVLVSGADVLFRELAEHVAGSSYAVLVIDGVTSSLSSAGLSGRDEQELTRWTDLLPRRAQMAICVDHVVKAVDERQGMAVGTQAKKSVVTGSSYEVVATTKFGRGSQFGRIRLILQKDKPGWLRGRSPKFSVTLRFRSDELTGAVSLTVPTEQETEQVVLAEASAHAEKRARADVIRTWLDSTFEPGTGQNKVLTTAHGSATERKQAGGRNCGSHNDWPRDEIRAVWRVWTALTCGDSAASPDDQWERELYAEWMSSGKTGARQTIEASRAPASLLD